MRFLDDSLEHPGNHPQSPVLDGSENSTEWPSTRKMIWGTVLGVAMAIQLSFFAHQIAEGIQHHSDDLRSCEIIEPLKIADTYGAAARVIIDYSLSQTDEYETVLEEIMPGGTDIEVCGRDMRVYDILIVDRAIGFYEAPPIIPVDDVLNN